MKRFHLVRHEDETGISGTGIIAEGVQFDRGDFVISWLTQHSSLGIYRSEEEMMAIHGHGGKTTIAYFDGDV
jgi:prepilin-type processing-associated H-X9-DG protein